MGWLSNVGDYFFQNCVLAQRNANRLDVRQLNMLQM